MTKLGTYPSRRYSRSWITQRLLNRGPSWAWARRSPVSICQQVLNPVSRDIQDTMAQLTRERYNNAPSIANMNMLGLLYKAKLPAGMQFGTTDRTSGQTVYTEPSVYATISSTEYEISIAENNDIQTLWDEALPTRVEYGEETRLYSPVVDVAAVSSISTTTPGEVPLEGHLYITLLGNETWETRTFDKIYYSKLSITGTTRKGIEGVEEVIPLRLNETVQTINQWDEVTSVRVSYLSDDAQLTIESLPINANSIADTRNINVTPNGEYIRYARLADKAWGSTFITESYTLPDMDDVRRTGLEEKDIESQIELLDSDGNNITATGFAFQQDTNYLYVIDNNNLYVYDSSLPYPDVSATIEESPDPKIDLYCDRWVFCRDDQATIKTRNLDLSKIPFAYRWTLTTPAGVEYHLDDDGNRELASIDEGWIDNPHSTDFLWLERRLEITLDEVGTFVLALECQYFNESTAVVTSYITQLIFLVPAIRPETTIALPVELQNGTGLAFDSDGQLWIHQTDRIRKADIYYDYFLVDYAANTIWLRENYTSVRVVV